MSFELIRSYITNRKQYVKFKTLESDYMAVKCMQMIQQFTLTWKISLVLMWKKINSWLSQNKLSLNTDKTKCMTVHTHQKNIHPLTFSINGKQIVNVSFLA